MVNEIEQLTLYSKLLQVSDQESHDKMVYRVGILTDSWNNIERRICLFGLPVFTKERIMDDTLVKVFGIPVIKLIRRGTIKKYCIFNIPIRTKLRTDIVTDGDYVDIERQLQRLKDMEVHHLEPSV